MIYNRTKNQQISIRLQIIRFAQAKGIRWTPKSRQKVHYFKLYSSNQCLNISSFHGSPHGGARQLDIFLLE